MQRETALVQVVHYPQGLSFGCKVCRNVFASGKYAIGIAIGVHRYLVGPEEPITCCGEGKVSILVFDSESEAGAACEHVMKVLERDGNTENVRLLELA